MKILVGHTGFVGFNLMKNMNFDKCYNSKNIQQAFGKNPQLCVYSGVPSEMFTANTMPEKDLLTIKNAMENIKKINAKTLVLISTVAVYDKTVKVNENHIINKKMLKPYGLNRLLLEEYCISNFENMHIIRLPALFGNNLKKNFLFDLKNITPPQLTKQKYDELLIINNDISNYFKLGDNGRYHCTNLQAMKPFFESIDFNALNFTHSESRYQFFNLKYLPKLIERVIEENIKILNAVTMPLSAKTICKQVKGKDFDNILNDEPFNYDIESIHFNGGYFKNGDEVLSEIKEFLEVEQ